MRVNRHIRVPAGIALRWRPAVDVARAGKRAGEPTAEQVLQHPLRVEVLDQGVLPVSAAQRGRPIQVAALDRVIDPVVADGQDLFEPVGCAAVDCPAAGVLVAAITAGVVAQALPDNLQVIARLEGEGDDSPTRGSGCWFRWSRRTGSFGSTIGVEINADIGIEVDVEPDVSAVVDAWLIVVVALPEESAWYVTPLAMMNRRTGTLLWIARRR